MNIPEAIEILNSNGLKPEGTTWGEYLEATQLSIEALKREQHRRKYDIHLPIELFPGETEE